MVITFNHKNPVFFLAMKRLTVNIFEHLNNASRKTVLVHYKVHQENTEMISLGLIPICY